MVQREMLSMKKINEVLRAFILKEMDFFNFFFYLYIIVPSVSCLLELKS